MLSSDVLFPHWIGTALILIGGLVVACTENPTVVRVVVSAEASIAERAALLEVSVEGPEGARERRSIDPREGAFPFEVVVVPEGGDASRDFRVTVTVEDSNGAVLGVQRLAAGFERGQTRHAALHFSEACRGVECAATARCVDGACRSACGQPAREPGPADDCDLGDGGAADSGPPDLGPPDLGVPDAGPESCRLEEAAVVERFETDDLGRPCPDFEAEPQKCSSADHSSLSVVDPAGEGPATFCGPSGALHVLHPDDSRASNAYFALPASDLGSKRVLRTRMRIPSASHETMVAVNRPLSSFVALYAGRRVAGPVASIGVTWLDEGVLRVDGYGPGGASFRTTTAARFPVDDWFCLQLDLDLEAGTVQLAIDGVAFAPVDIGPVGDAFRDQSVTYARVGPSAPAVSIPLLIQYDDLALGAVPLPCRP